MTPGFLAMFDALGFRGIWKRSDAGQVIEKLKTLEDTANVEMASRMAGHRSRPSG